ncbi:D,D-heptose 1,7-bisphosphate phosphatase [archaeon]|nr:D,D-heptose 1,7-bisphosphate phosphatase [archaeon]|tara:strand:+ start:436 stop:969 length:534 start_codon:yes stop_codon:yes gene_type:complete
MNKAIFLDRDNTLIEDKEGHIHEIEKFKLLDGVIEGLKKLSETDYKLIIVTDQGGGIGRGLYTEEDYEKFNNHMLNIFKENGIRIDKVYHCPHHPDLNCSCRKPKPGMLLKAKEEFDVDINKSWFLGDKVRDIETGKSVNVKMIGVIGYEEDREKLESANPDYVVDNFLEAVEIILK